MIEFENQIQSAIRDAARTFGRRQLCALLEELRDLSRPPEDRHRAWSDFIGRYRSEPSDPWSVVLLESVRIDLVALSVAVPLPPWLDRDDINNQIVFEVLSAASGEDVQPARWTPNRLVSRATVAVHRWLENEIERRVDHKETDVGDPALDSEAMFSLAEIVADAGAGRIPAGPLALAARRAGGESLGELARLVGEPLEAFSRRQRRHMEAIRGRLAA